MLVFFLVHGDILALLLAYFQKCDETQGTKMEEEMAGLPAVQEGVY